MNRYTLGINVLGEGIVMSRLSLKWLSVYVWLVLGLSACVWAGGAFAQSAGLSDTRESGIRAGSGDDFDVIEIYTRWDSEWLQEGVADRIGLQAWRARWDLTVGYWDGSADENGFAAIGPVVEWHAPAADLRVSLGVQPTLISSHNGNGKDLGGPFQFTSHFGLAWVPPGALILGLRIQHTSNAGIYDNNPGVDIVSAEVGYAF